MTSAISRDIEAARALLARGCYADAIRACQRVLGADAANSEALEITGLARLGTGQTLEALSCLHTAVRATPARAGAWLSLGGALLRLGRSHEAVRLLQGAEEHCGHTVDVLGGLAEAQLAAGHTPAAIESYRRCVALDPGCADLRNSLGAALQRSGDLHGSIACFRQALSLDARHVRALNNLGRALRQIGRPQEALSTLRSALLLSPHNAVTLTNLGFAWLDLAQPREALQAFEQALVHAPRLPEAHHGLGRALRDCGEPARATGSLQLAAALKPADAQILVDLGRTLIQSGDCAQAIACLQRASELGAPLLDAHHYLGVALYGAGRTAAALASFERALAIDPSHLRSHDFRGRSLSMLGRLDEAIASLERAQALWAQDSYALGAALNCYNRMCDWPQVRQALQRMRALHGAPPHSFVLTLSDDPEEHASSARQQAAAAMRGRSALPPAPVCTHERIRIAYVSADYHAHATAFLIAELLELHDRSAFQIHGVSIGPRDQSAVRARLAGACAEFVEVADRSDRDIAEWLRSRQIDIAVDLKGYTSYGRPGIFAYRPAPLQVNYLGFPGTMAAPFIDYLIADEHLIPADSRRFYSEQIAYLPHTYQPNDRQRAIGVATPSRAALGLPPEAFVFCCFNNLWKITSEVFDVWMRLLAAVQGSVLWLLEDNPWACANLRRAAAERGVAPERILFCPRLQLPEHLARQRAADLFLDTLPYNAHTTASDALWAGLPVLTCSGRSFAARVAGSLLRAAGLGELLTSSLADYEQLALSLARDPARLRGLSARLRAQRDGLALFDTPRYTRHLEAAYRHMWRGWQRGEAPRTFHVAP